MTRHTRCLLVAGLIAAVASPGNCAEPLPGWRTVSGSWSQQGAGVTSGPGRCVLKQADPSPSGDLAVKAAVTIEPGTGQSWAAVGIMAYFDSANHWRLALVQAPDNADRRYAELVEMYDGIWQAQNEPATLLESEQQGELRWSYGESYELELRMSADGVTGTVSQRGELLWSKRYAIPPDADALRMGWAGIETLDMTGTFSDIQHTSVVGARPSLGPMGAEALVMQAAVPGGGPAAADAIAGAIRKAGMDARLVSPTELLELDAAGLMSVPLLAIPECRVLPAPLRDVIYTYLRGGGHLLLTGGPAFETWLYEYDGKWQTVAEILQDLRPESHVFTFGGEKPLEGWYRAANDSSLREQVTPDQAPPAAQGSAVHLKLDDFTGWDTWTTAVPEGAISADQTVTTFWAKGTAETQHITLEWKERDEARWIAGVKITDKWQRYAIPGSEFHYWKDSRAQGRGTSNDHLQMDNVAYFAFGLAQSHSPIRSGPHEYWVADVGVAASPISQSDAGSLDLESVSPWYKTYRPPQISSTSQELWGVSAVAMGGPVDSICAIPRPTGKGFYGDRTGRWLPHVSGHDDEGKEVGAVAWSYVDFGPRYYGAMWTCIGLDGRSLAKSPALVDGVVSEIVARRRQGVVFVEAGADQASYQPGEAVTVGAEIINVSREPQSVALSFTYASRDGRDVTGVIGETLTLELAPGERKRVSMPWDDAPEWSAQVSAGLAQTRDGISYPVDRISQFVRRLKPVEEPQFVTARDGDFWLGNEKWYPHGCNFWPLYVSGMAPNVYNRHWLTPQTYDGELVEKDLALAEQLGMTSLSVILSTFEQIPCFNDFAARCKAHGLRINAYIAGAHPASFDEAFVTELLARARLAENDAVWAYDIAWEPRWGTEDDRKRYDPDWLAWIEDNYGSLQVAEKLWGCEVNRDEAGSVAAPSNRQILNDGEWNVMVAAYRRFVDDYLNRKYNHACGVLRELDPNHLISHRVGYGGTGSWGAITPMAYDPISGAKHLDFTSPEGWGLRTDWAQFKSAGFITSYCRYAGNGKPVFWSEYGMNLHPGYLPEEYEHQGRIHEWLCRMVLLSEANGDASWWWPGGYRVNENSDYGIIHPWREPRQAALALKQYAGQICAPRNRETDRKTIVMERDKYVQGLAGAWREYADQYSQMITPDSGVDVITPATGKNTADMPLKGVGGVPYEGIGPVQYLDGEFNRLEVKIGDGEWTRVEGNITAPEGATISIRANMGNTGDVQWLSRPGEGQVYLAIQSGAQILRAPISADCPRYGDVDTVALQLPALGKGTYTAAAHLAIDGRVPRFGEKHFIALEVQ